MDVNISNSDLVQELAMHSEELKDEFIRRSLLNANGGAAYLNAAGRIELPDGTQIWVE